MFLVRPDHRQRSSPRVGQSDFCGVGMVPDARPATGLCAASADQSASGSRPELGALALLVTVKGSGMQHEIFPVPSPTGAIDWTSEVHHFAIVDRPGGTHSDGLILMVAGRRQGCWMAVRPRRHTLLRH